MDIPRGIHHDDEAARETWFSLVGVSLRIQGEVEAVVLSSARRSCFCSECRLALQHAAFALGQYSTSIPGSSSRDEIGMVLHKDLTYLMSNSGVIHGEQLNKLRLFYLGPL